MSAPTLPVFEGGGRSRVLAVMRHPQARRLRLLVDPRDGAVRLVLPRRHAISSAVRWAEEHRDWVEAALAKLPAPVPILPGARLPFEGGELVIEWDVGRPRAPMLRPEDGVLAVGGPVDTLAPRVLRWLRAEALARLAAETREFADLAAVAVPNVGVGDARGRWGSCSADGTIRYSWRLILAPAPVRRATVAHEVAHRLHMDHSPAFHTAVSRLLGHKPTAERDWLKRHGAGLHWVGREE